MSKVLFVDPDPDQTVAAKFFFSSNTPHELYAIDDEPVLRTALSYRPDIIILDSEVASCINLCQQLSVLPPLASVPVIVMGGGQHLLQSTRFLDAGAFDFIRKPLDFDELTLRVNSALRTSRAITHPLTRLPTGQLINEALASDPDAARISVRVEAYNDFKERYGFLVAGEVIRFVAQLLEQQEISFVGQMDDDTFILLCSPECADDLKKRLLNDVQPQLLSFHSFIEQEQGFMEIRLGTQHVIQTPLLSLNVEITTT